MNPNSPPGPHTTRLDLASGASRTFLLRAGASIVCLSGSLLIDAPRLAENGAPCPPLRLNASEAQGVGTAACCASPPSAPPNWYA